VLALLDAFHQLNRRGEAFFDVVAHLAVGGIARQQPPVKPERAGAAARHLRS